MILQFDISKLPRFLAISVLSAGAPEQTTKAKAKLHFTFQTNRTHIEKLYKNKGKNIVANFAMAFRILISMFSGKRIDE